MAASLSAYWVKFFKNAGFPQDVATKHAVVFSNNRIKPDMLPDLDKPSLKEMGITLMGDMIAILRYAKKVVEETTCERFLVDSEDSDSKLMNKPIVKKVVTKVPSKSTVSTKTKTELLNTKKIVKIPSTSDTKTVTVKKTISTPSGAITEFSTHKRQVPLKRKLDDTEQNFDSNSKDEWSVIEKKLKVPDDDKDDKVGYTVILPKGSTSRSQQLLKKSVEQKRTVFDRLGDSSVTSTTNLAETSPTFNVTGLGKDVYKRSMSVFKRLGDKDAKKELSISQISKGILKNGTGTTNSSGILKNWSTTKRASIVSTKKIIPKTIGTMRADQEASMKNATNNVKQLVRTTKKITFNDNSVNNTRPVKSVMSGKLASERLTTIPAKARLGVVRTNPKQVTFNRTTSVTHIKKPDVFSRLGI